MKAFPDRLIEAVQRKQTPCIVGLDPRLHEMPKFVRVQATRKRGADSAQAARQCIVEFNRRVINSVADLVPAVKPQIAFYEQYGLAGMSAFQETIRIAKDAGLIVIVDAKRNDISSTAEAYGNALLGRTKFLRGDAAIYDVDCITVSPYLGEDSLEPFVDICRRFGKGIFVLVKTSNPGSKDFQDLDIADEPGAKVYRKVAEMVNRLAATAVGSRGYSAIGAVVGATFPQEAQLLRKVMPRSIFLVPGYGVQGGRAEDVAMCFNDDGLGAVVNASRSITYAFASEDITEDAYDVLVRERMQEMISEIRSAIGRRERRA